MDWISWHEANLPQRVTPSMIDDYHKVMNSHYVTAMQAVIAVAVYDVDLHRKLLATLDRIEELDSAIAITLECSDRDRRKEIFEETFKTAAALRTEWTMQLADAMGRIDLIPIR